MPKAYYKQQVSFLNGAIWQLPDGPAQQARDNAMSLELSGKPFIRSINLYGDPVTLLSVYGYDAGDHADSAIFEFIKGRSPTDEEKAITKDVADTCMGWFLPAEYEGKQINSIEALIS
jgi:salicylate hydroxylase